MAAFADYFAGLMPSLLIDFTVPFKASLLESHPIASECYKYQGVHCLFRYPYLCTVLSVKELLVL